MKRAACLSVVCVVLVAAALVLAGPALAGTPLVDAWGTDPPSPLLKGWQVTFQFKVWGDWTVASVPGCTVVVLKHVRGGRDEVVVAETSPFALSTTNPGTDQVVNGPSWTVPSTLKPGNYSWRIRLPAGTTGIAYTGAGLTIVRRLPTR